MRFNFWHKLFFLRESDRYALLFVILMVMSGIAVGVILDLRGGSRYEDYRKAASRYSSDGHSARQSADNGYAQQDIGYGDGSRASGSVPSFTPFPFDPNVADSTTLLRLGLMPWMVRNIYRYRAHGGRYRRPEDFARTYGLTLAHYRKLEPYIRIEQEVMAADVVGRGSDNHAVTAPRSESYTAAHSSVSAYPVKLTLSDEKVDVNTADTILLKRIPGIGSYFARRIVELRAHRGAFVSTEELLAIRNFPETALSYMTVSQNFAPIHVNSMTLQQLHQHPLINYTQARDICSLRRTSGPIRSMADMEFIRSFTPEQLRRMEPFLKFD